MQYRLSLAVKPGDMCGLGERPCSAVLSKLHSAWRKYPYLQPKTPSKKTLLRTPINRVSRMPTKSSQPAFYLDSSSIRFLTYFFCTTWTPHSSCANQDAWAVVTPNGQRRILTLRRVTLIHARLTQHHGQGCNFWKSLRPLYLSLVIVPFSLWDWQRVSLSASTSLIFGKSSTLSNDGHDLLCWLLHSMSEEIQTIKPQIQR